MRGISRGFLGFAVTCVAALSFAQGTNTLSRPNALMPGDPAPAMSVASWVKGDPVSAFDKGKVYVVEFWATWCGPCKQTIPHLTELQKKYEGKATFIGVSTFEHDQSGVAPFVEQMGKKMDYRVAMDKVAKGDENGQNGDMAKTWMEAAGQNGIPTAFIIDRDTKVAWIGHPMTMEEPLQKVIAGTWNTQEYSAQLAKDLANQGAEQAIGKKLADELHAKDYDAALKTASDLAQYQPSQAAILKYEILLRKGDYDSGYSYGKELMNGMFKDDAMGLNSLAWPIADPKSPLKKRDFDFALSAATKAAELTKNENPDILDTLAWSYYGKGNKAKAIETEKKALSLAPEDQKAGFQGSLNSMQK